VSVVTSGDRDVGNFVGYVVISEVRSHRDVRMLGLSLLNVDGRLLATETHELGAFQRSELLQKRIFVMNMSVSDL